MVLASIEETLFACLLSFSKRGSMPLPSFLVKAQDFVPSVNESIVKNNPFLKVEKKLVSFSEKGKNHKFTIYRKLYVLNQFARKQLSLGEKDALSFNLKIIPFIDDYLLERLCVLVGHIHGSGPKGECCIIAKKTDYERVIPLYKLAVNQAAEILFIKTEAGELSSRLVSQGMAPGTKIRLTQIFPAYVLSLADGSIALEAALAKSIYVKILK